MEMVSLLPKSIRQSLTPHRSFLIQVPIAITCCLLIARGLRTVLPMLEAEEHQQECEQELKPAKKSFDYPGAITLAIWISALLSVIDLQDQLGWQHPLVLGIVIVGGCSLVAFLILETWSGGRELLIPLKLLKTQVGAFCAGAVSDISFRNFRPLYVAIP